MKLERERKFKVKYIPNYILEDSQILGIRQTYLSISSNSNLRVRVTNGIIADICYKISLSYTDRKEFEYEIPLGDGLELINATKNTLTKKRYYYPTWDKGMPIIISVDVYDNGLQVVEVEMDQFGDQELSQDFFDRNQWIGEEITGKSEYSNIQIALNNANNG
jgi:adenylate cyclase